MRSFLLVVLLCIVIPLSACGKLINNTSRRGQDEGREDDSGDQGAESVITDGSKLPVDKLDVCSQLTREEVEAALGRSVLEPTRGTELTSRRSGTITSACMFGSREGFVSLGVKRQNPASTLGWNAARAYEELKNLIIQAGGGDASGRVEKVSGVGIDAFAETKEETVNYQTTELRVLSKHSILTIRVAGPAATATLEAAKTLAAKAIPRLEKYEEETAIAVPLPRPTAHAPRSDRGDDQRSRARERAGAGDKSTKEVERPPAQKRDAKATSTKISKNNSRRANESSSKESKQSAKRTADRTNKERTKTASARLRSRRRS